MQIEHYLQGGSGRSELSVKQFHIITSYNWLLLVNVMSLWCLISMTTWWRLRRSGRACTFWSRICWFEAAWLFSLRLVIHAYLNKSLNEIQIVRLIFRSNCCIAEQLDANNLCLNKPVIISTIFKVLKLGTLNWLGTFPLNQSAANISWRRITRPICSKF